MRGFVEHVQIKWPWADDLTRLAALQPVGELTLFPSEAGDSSTGEPAALLSSPLIPRLRSLALERFPKKGDVASHLAALPLPNLRALTVSACKLDNAGARALARAAFPALAELSLVANTFGAPGMTALVDAFGERLRRLRISEHRIDAKLVRALSSSPRLRSLEELVLEDAPLEAEWVRELCESQHLAGARLVLRVSDVVRDAWPLVSARSWSCRLVASEARIEGELVTITLCIDNPSDRSVRAMKPHLAVRGRSTDHGIQHVDMKIDHSAWNGIDAFAVEPGVRHEITLEFPRAELTRLEDHVAPGAWGIALSMPGAGAMFVQIAR